MPPTPDRPHPGESGRRAAEDGESIGWRATWLPFAFVVLSLVALIVVPLRIGNRIQALQQDITNVLEPARTQVGEVEAAVALEISAISKFLITGDARFAAEYRRALAEERDAFDRLEELADAFGPEARERYIELRTLAERWSEWVVEQDLFRERRAVERLPERISLEQGFYEDVVMAARRLQAVLERSAERKRREILAAERFETLLTIGLVLVALAAAAVVFQLGRRLQRLNRESERRRRQVEEVLESRTRLIRGLSHDLKNPLGAAAGYAELLESGTHGDITAEQEQVTTRIRRLVGQAVHLLDDLLVLSRAEAGRLSIEDESVDAAALITEAIDDHRAAIEAAGLDLRIEIADGLPTVSTDPRRVRQILDNLLSNATKYTSAGGHVELRATVRSGDEPPGSGHWLAAAVGDTGPGIAPHEQEKIFEEFYRAESARGEEPGTGLGLAMSRRIAQLLGGDVAIESTVGVGSTFTLWLPLDSDREP